MAVMLSKFLGRAASQCDQCGSSLFWVNRLGAVFCESCRPNSDLSNQLFQLMVADGMWIDPENPDAIVSRIVPKIEPKDFRSEDRYGSFLDAFKDFIRLQCRLGPELKIKSSDLYDAYALWTLESKTYTVTQKVFGGFMSRIGIVRLRNNGIHYVGISLKNTVNQIESH